MKTMTCRQLGGACGKEFRGGSFEEIADLSKKHAMEMIQKSDADHLKALNEMKDLMLRPEAMKEWFEQKKREFEALPEE